MNQFQRMNEILKRTYGKFLINAQLIASTNYIIHVFFLSESLTVPI